MTVQTLTIDQLVVSDFNVRLNEEDANATTALEDSIEASGLWLPLVVHPITVVPSLKSRGTPQGATAQLWGVLDGGRRCRAIKKLADAGRIARDWPIDCVVRDVDPAKITELSLGAALLARELRAYEIDAAVARMEAEGMDTAEIARNLGQPIEWVMQRLRLGTLAPAIFEAYAAGEVSLEQAQAYGSVADHDLQLAAFTHLSALREYDRRPAVIRAFLKVGDRELEKLLRFVGPEVYRAAGGAYDLDMFADQADQRGRVADEALLRRLVENKFGTLRQDLRRRATRSDLRFTAEPPKHNGYPDHTLELHPVATADNGVLLPSGAIIARIEICDDGSHRETFWWESRRAKSDAAKAERQANLSSATPIDTAIVSSTATARASVSADAGFTSSVNYVAAAAARAAVKEEHGLTADGLHVMRSTRRELLRALLIRDAEDGLGTLALGRDYIVWAQLRQALRHPESAHAVGARGLSSAWIGSDDNEPIEVVRPHLEQAEAHAVWERAVGRIKAESFITLEDPCEALERFVEADERTKSIAGAVLAGIALLRSANVPGWRIPAHDRLAALAGGSDEALRGFWAATADFVAMFPKLKRLELAQPFEDPLAIKNLVGKKDGEITRAATNILGRAEWVHPMLSFKAAEPAKKSRSLKPAKEAV